MDQAQVRLDEEDEDDEELEMEGGPLTGSVDGFGRREMEDISESAAEVGSGFAEPSTVKENNATEFAQEETERENVQEDNQVTEGGELEGEEAEDVDIDTVDDYDTNTMIRIKDKDVSSEKPKEKDSNFPPKQSDEEKSPSNGEEDESDVIKIGEMYVRLDNGSTLSENAGSGDDDDNDASNMEEELVEHYAEAAAGNVVVQATLPVIQQPEAIFIPSPSPEPSSEQRTRTDEVTPVVNKLPSLPSLPTGDSASSLGLDTIPPAPQTGLADISTDDAAAFPPPPPEVIEFDAASLAAAATPKVTVLPSSPAPEAADEVVCVSLPPRALSRISERSNSDAAAANQLQLVSPRSISPASEASKGPAEDTMSDQNYASSEDNDNPPSLCSDLPDNANVDKNGAAAGLPLFRSLDDAQKDQFPSPPSSLLEGTATLQECGTEVTQIEPDSLFLELSPPDEEEEAFLRAQEEEAEPAGGGTLERRREKIPYDFSISSENEVTNKEGENSAASSLHGSMEILEEVATEDHFEHDDVNTDTDDDCQMPKDIFEMAPLDAALQERAEQQLPQLPQPDDPCDLFDFPPLRSRGNEYIL
jgi:hypothetical protein